MPQKQTQKSFAVRRVIGRYDISGIITCSPAPKPGVETEAVRHMIDEKVTTMVSDRMIKDLFGEPQ